MEALSWQYLLGMTMRTFLLENIQNEPKLLFIMRVCHHSINKIIGQSQSHPLNLKSNFTFTIDFNLYFDSNS